MEYASLPPGLLTTRLAAKAAGVEPATIRDWVRRGILQRAGGSPRRPYYTVQDVTAAKMAAKPNSARTRRANVHPA
ncbi:MerR family transcriptional regulator [Streptomyces sp. NBC_00557]|uniref:MerR family transcriptional regulator n=1 Tax=Streptomyces sp. NBC_00557 TaxID=2975776 RepID=UPI002E80C090|nr:MerR family transcriptional regulator [Streptomyces sp. NBC_00557]WUC36385.1 helix-turn-helix domain-containing protein [Streptomyces sp. NBC_00557]